MQSENSFDKISEVQFVPIKAHDGMIGFASVVLNNGYYLGSIGVHTRRDGSGFRLTYPTKAVGSQEMHVHHPINRDAAEQLEREIFQKVSQVLKQA